MTDYSKYPLYLSTITPDNDGDCGTATIHVEGSGDDIPYYTINGVRRVLSRELKLNYYDDVWNDSTHYNQELVTELQTGYKPIIVIPAPLCSTTFTLTGDRFMDFWNGPSRNPYGGLFKMSDFAFCGCLAYVKLY